MTAVSWEIRCVLKASIMYSTASAGAKQKEDDGDEAAGRGGWGRKQICFLSLFTDDAVCFLTFLSFLFLSNEALRQTGFSRMPASLVFFFPKTNK